MNQLESDLRYANNENEQLSNELVKLISENKVLRVALETTINSPQGVVPAIALEFSGKTLKCEICKWTKQVNNFATADVCEECFAR